MIGRVLAALTAPLLLALLFFATTPADRQVGTAALWGGYYVMAHVYFWPPVIATHYVARRSRIDSAPHLIALMAGCSLLFTFAFGVVPAIILSSDYTWRGAVRDEVSETFAAVAGFVLYRALLGSRPAGSIGEAPR